LVIGDWLFGAGSRTNYLKLATIVSIDNQSPSTQQLHQIDFWLRLPARLGFGDQRFGDRDKESQTLHRSQLSGNYRCGELMDGG
jgi:hypothetical protein